MSTNGQPSPPPMSEARSHYNPQRLASTVARGLRRTLSSGLSASRNLPPSPGEQRSDALDPTTGTSPYQTTIPSPLSFAVTQVSSGTSSSTSNKQGSEAAHSLPSVGGKSSASRTFLEVLSQAGKRISRPVSFRSGSSSQQSSQRSSPLSVASTTSSEDTCSEEHRQHVNALVSDYLEMTDRQDSGFVDVSRMQRRLGVGPKRMTKRELYYEVFGSGPKRLFLIMGMMGCTMYWRLQTRYFSHLGDYTVCVFDNCGSGRSTIAPGPYRISQLARDACRVLEHIGWHDDIHMVGISLGGMVAQEMCLLDPSERPQFASVAFADTWHNSTLAVPTVKEVRFAFSGMAALGDDPKHLINLVFSRSWISQPFHDTVREAELCAAEAEIPTNAATNRDVMTGLFRAIQLELSLQRGAQTETHSEQVSPEKSPTADRSLRGLDAHGPISAERHATTSQLSSPGPSDHNPRPVVYSQTEPARRGSGRRAPIPPGLEADAPVGPIKREVAGDIHQFMACLGHRLGSERVRQIRARNPETRFMVIHGEKDRVIRPVCGRTLAKLLECPIVWIRRSGHMPPIDAHCTFNLIVRAFTRNERWLRELPDRTGLAPASWAEQVRVRRWISGGSPESGSDVRDEINIAFDDSLDPRAARLSLGSVPQIAAGQPPNGNRRDSKIAHIQPVGPLHRELFFVDEGDAELAARIIPANAPSLPQLGRSTSSTSAASGTSTASQPQNQQSTREMIIYGALLDAPLRIRRYPSDLGISAAS
ncbi:hypothetical protein IWW51_000387 [Coemansia sp. RSA 2702]|nr:hypothetical protein IWW54_004609 [Coemansia sp. RSA 2705]KAJ2314234.1 hypothetical protein IWW52_004346 [Coemansia sp. RSA 2704]KAJ2329790.1 hypothetical protein IWW51_000387 [Coemansia sp. RSA 2702]KAJ2739447.1 hypothetical protein H4R23_000463 [Coemansia sp. Cherry 401B]